MQISKQSSIKETRELLTRLLNNSSTLKKDLRELMDDERVIIRENTSQLKDLGKYVKTHWKEVVPALAVLGLSTLLSLDKKPMKKAKRPTPKAKSRKKTMSAPPPVTMQ